ncbi:hypothetical protein QE152_g38052 [Popillia japonica]|uniref:Mutator-like transposase domain-containing protein n=1 Tax=Popillia japonica TaxID=7064 RepID=A0AAW1I901_POPJA
MARKREGAAYEYRRHYRNRKSQKLREIWKERRCEVHIAHASDNENNHQNNYPYTGTSSLNKNSWGETDAEYESVMNRKLHIEVEEPVSVTGILSGNYIVDLQYMLQEVMQLQYTHSVKCTFGKIEVSGEKNSYGLGLVREIELKCRACSKLFKVRTEDPKHEKSYINTAFVWGTLSSGGTFHQTKEVLQHLNISPMNYRQFSDIEENLQSLWKDTLWESMEKAGKEEHEIAKNKGNIDINNIASTTVYVDGGWSKRSYGHNYNASSGTPVIIGKETGKLLFLSVRNKYCSICARATNQQLQVREHLCWKNWNGSSAGMEADILVEGFNKSIEMHNLKHATFVGDGDSNVYCKLKERVTYGLEINKIEYSNHVIENYGKFLFELKKDNSINCSARNMLTSDKIKKLQQSLQKCIYSANGNVEKMNQFIANVPFHVFDDHATCDSSYCNVVGVTTNSKKARLFDTGLIYHLSGAVDNIMRKSYKLIKKETNNQAEAFMSVLCKFNCVKWEETAWKKFTNKEIGDEMIQFINGYHHKRSSIKDKRKPKKRQSKNVQLSNEYGPSAEECPLTGKEMESQISRILDSLNDKVAHMATVLVTVPWSNGIKLRIVLFIVPWSNGTR